MLYLASMTVYLFLVFPSPSDFNLANKLLDSNCEINHLDEIIPRKSVMLIENEFTAYRIFEPSFEYLRVYNAIHRICIDLEISHGNEYIYDNLSTLRERKSYYQNYPNPIKFNFHISKYEIVQKRNFALSYKNNLERRIYLKLEIDREDILRNALYEATELFLFWDNLYDSSEAGGHSISFYRRKEALIKIYEYLGEKDFFEGNYPPCAPFWRFNYEN